MKTMRIGSYVSAFALAIFMGAAIPAFAADSVTTIPAGNTGSDAINQCSGANGFVSLSCIPGFADATQQDGLADFFNLLYKLAIGMGVVIAVLQLVRAGIMYMGSDSFTEKKDARNLIGATLLGLVLVLSPVVVLGIINPDINSLKLDTSRLNVTGGASHGLDGTSSLKVDTPTETQVPTYIPFSTGQSITENIKACNGNDCSAILNGSDCSSGFWAGLGGVHTSCFQTCVDVKNSTEVAAKRAKTTSENVTCDAGQAKGVYIEQASGGAGSPS
jgi:hypothetical protein